MSFDLYRADGEVIRYGDDARFSFTATGHLVIYDGAHKIVFGQHSWDRVEEPVPPPGK
ncbi:hypothetical protein ACU610_09540 [Geodermatophilus sp. URMC 61]|uniref:hypothetical protein n=1 Tax=Geodermatophilus sp. URMC 61 TaxID=3423411 RepID=UPI00406C0AFE